MEVNVSTKINVQSHLYQLYPQMPRYAADPSQSIFIQNYQNIMNRFQGHYGQQPTIFVKSPTFVVLHGDTHQYSGYQTLGLSSLQNIIIAISKNNSKKIRINNYQKAVYGQQIFSSDPSQWKFQKQTKQQDKEYINLLIAILKITLDNNYGGIDILIYWDFIIDDYLQWKPALIYGFYTAIQSVIFQKKVILDQDLIMVCKKIYQMFHYEQQISSSILYCQYNNLLLQPFHNQIQFPKNCTLVIANSMTPLPKKLVNGKRFNLRRCQIMIGIQLIKSQVGISKNIKSLKQLQKNIESHTIKQFIQYIDQILIKKQLTKEQIQEIIDCSLIDVLKEIPYANCVIDQNVYYSPYKRIMFYLKQQFILEDIITKYKNLQKSIQKNSQNYQSQFDKLFLKILVQSLSQTAKNAKQYLNQHSQQIQQMLKVTAGLYLSYKIVGNGWGGNILFIAEKNMGNKIIDVLHKQFYLKQQNRVLLGDDLDMYCMEVQQPATGLCILNPQSQIWY